MPAVSTFGKRWPYRNPSQGHLWWRILQTSIWRRNCFYCDRSKTSVLWTPLASLPNSWPWEMKEEDHGAEITCQFCQTTYNLMKTTWRIHRDKFSHIFMIALLILNCIELLKWIPAGWCLLTLAFRTIAKELELTCCHGNGLWQGNPIQQRKTLHMLHIDEGETWFYPTFSDEDSASHAQQNSSKKTPRPISSISTWAAQLTKSWRTRLALCTKDLDKIYSIKQGPPNPDIPSLSVMRTGWSDPSLAVENGALAAECWCLCSLLCMVNLREQMHRSRRPTLQGCSSFDQGIPFIANGDIRTVQEAKQRIEEVGLTLSRLARSHGGTPIFQPDQPLLETGDSPDLTFED